MSSEIARLRLNDGSDALVLAHIEVGGKLVTSATPTSSFAESITVVSSIHKHALAAISALQVANPSDDKEPLKQDDDDDDFDDDADNEEPAEKQRRTA